MSKKTRDVAVGFCLDESGSMDKCLSETVNGFNAYRDQLAGQKGKTTVTLTMFSDTAWYAAYSQAVEPTYRTFCVAKPVKKLEALVAGTTYRPRGNTPLFDAIGNTIRNLEEEIKSRDDVSVTVVIQTDGFENASREFSREAIAKLIRKKEKAGWTFVYLGANMDDATAEREAASFGLIGASMGYEGAKSGQAFAAAAGGTAYLRSSAERGVTLDSATLASSVRSNYQNADEQNINATNAIDPNHWSAVDPNPAKKRGVKK